MQKQYKRIFDHLFVIKLGMVLNGVDEDEIKLALDDLDITNTELFIVQCIDALMLIAEAYELFECCQSLVELRKVIEEWN